MRLVIGTALALMLCGGAASADDGCGFVSALGETIHFSADLSELTYSRGKIEMTCAVPAARGPNGWFSVTCSDGHVVNMTAGAKVSGAPADVVVFQAGIYFWTCFDPAGKLNRPRARD